MGASPGPPRARGTKRAAILHAVLSLVIAGCALQLVHGPIRDFLRRPDKLTQQKRASAKAAAAAAAVAAAEAYIVPGAAAPLSVVQSEVIHVVVTACGNPTEVEPEHYGLISVKSMLVARANGANPRRKMHFHLVANVLAWELLNTTKVNWDVSRYILRDPNLSLSTYSLQDMDHAAILAGAENVTEVPHHVFKSCSASRLKLPYLLKDVPRALYIDWDSVTTCDLALFWDLWGEPSMGWAPENGATGGGYGTAIFGMALNDPTRVSSKDIYANQPDERPRNGGVGAGIMMWNFAGMRHHGVLQHYWRALQKVVHSRVPEGSLGDYWVLSKAFPLGDQDMLWLAYIPPRWNVCMELFVPLKDSQEAGFERTIPCIVHFCGGWLVNDAKYMGLPNSPPHDGGVGLHLYFKRLNIMDDTPPPKGPPY